jgi:RNA polymerase sigma-70 factor (ECF subfamily)
MLSGSRSEEETAMTTGDPPHGPDPGHERDQDRGGELREFLDRIRAGDELAARELLARYEAQVRLVVRRQLPRLLRSRFDSLDVLQSVWASFFRRLRCGPEQFEDPRYLVAFLARVAKNKVVDQYRRAASRKHDMRREEPLSVRGSPPRELIADQDTASELAEAKETFGRLRDLLPADRREILGLKAEGLSSREIGERLGLSERTVRRALEDLKRRVEAGDQQEG